MYGLLIQDNESVVRFALAKTASCQFPIAREVEVTDTGFPAQVDVGRGVYWMKIVLFH